MLLSALTTYIPSSAASMADTVYAVLKETLQALQPISGSAKFLLINLKSRLLFVTVVKVIWGPVAEVVTL